MPISSPIYRIIRVFEGSPTNRVNAMSNDLTTKKTSRRGFRAYVTKKVGEIDQLISDYNDRQAAGGAGPAVADDFADTSEKIIADLQQIEQRWESEDKVNGEISCLITDEAQLDQELADQESYKDERLIIRMKVHKFINKNVQTSTIAQVHHTANLFVPQRNVAAASVSYREPTLQKFDGDIYKWQSWWELYDANVHSIDMPI
jgi:vacuolar-type H+-ATPase subunit I/STV1